MSRVEQEHEMAKINSNGFNLPKILSGLVLNNFNCSTTKTTLSRNVPDWLTPTIDSTLHNHDKHLFSFKEPFQACA